MWKNIHQGALTFQAIRMESQVCFFCVVILFKPLTLSEPSFPSVAPFQGCLLSPILPHFLLSHLSRADPPTTWLLCLLLTVPTYAFSQFSAHLASAVLQTSVQASFLGSLVAGTARSNASFKDHVALHLSLMQLYMHLGDNFTHVYPPPADYQLLRREAVCCTHH